MAIKSCPRFRGRCVNKDCNNYEDFDKVIEDANKLITLLKSLIEYIKSIGVEEGSRFITAEEIKKLNGIEENAQVNKIESVLINNNLLSIVNKIVNIPISDVDLGVVKSSDLDDEVNVQEDGTMEVNTLNVDKIYQDLDDVLVFSSGGSK